jgi:hypothetical protein
LAGQKPAKIDHKEMNPAEMAAEIRRQHKEIEYLKRQREILSLVLSTAESRLC